MAEEQQSSPTSGETSGKQPFDPRPYLMKLKGKDYLPVVGRVLAFRAECPMAEGWGIQTEAVEIDRERGSATFRAMVVDPAGRIVGTGTKQEDVKGFADYIEKAETGSIGRALAACGFGTAYALEFDEGDDPVDAPAGRPAAAAAPRTAPASGTGVAQPSGTCASCGTALTTGRMTMIKAKGLPNVCPKCEQAS